MNEEISHIIQWHELSERAKNFGLTITLTSSCFHLWKVDPKDPPMKELGIFHTLFDLRAGISNYVAEERISGRMKS
jgi:hypothetical protein